MKPKAYHPNWIEKPNTALAVGDRIVTKFDRKTHKALKGVKIKALEHDPRGCRAHVHVKTENGMGGCYDHVSTTAVFR